MQHLRSDGSSGQVLGCSAAADGTSQQSLQTTSIVQSLYLSTPENAARVFIHKRRRESMPPRATLQHAATALQLGRRVAVASLQLAQRCRPFSLSSWGA